MTTSSYFVTFPVSSDFLIYPPPHIGPSTWYQDPERNPFRGGAAENAMNPWHFPDADRKVQRTNAMGSMAFSTAENLKLRMQESKGETPFPAKLSSPG